MKSQSCLSLKEKSAYAMGDVASNFFFTFFKFFLFYYYTDSVGLSAGAIGTMFLVSRLWDMINDPVMGALADRTRSRWGSYRPYLLFVAIPYGIFGYLMFFNPDFSDKGKLIYAFITYSLMMTAFTAINIPYAAMSGVMTPNSSERTALSSFRFMGAYGGGLILTLAARPLVRYFGDGNEAEGYRTTMALFAICSVMLFWITFKYCKERVKPAADQVNSWRKDLGSLSQNRPWKILTVIFIVHGTYTTIQGAVSIHFFKYWVGDDGSAAWGIFDLATLFLVTNLVFSLIGAWATRYLNKYLDKRVFMILSTALSACVMFLFYFARGEHVAVLFGLQVIYGLSVGPLPVLIWAMFADTADYGELKTGYRNTGMVFSAALFGMKLGLALGGALSGWVLAYYGFIGNEEQTESSLFGILLCFSVIPGVLALLKAALLFTYPLKDSAMIDIEEALLERKEGGQASA